MDKKGQNLKEETSKELTELEKLSILAFKRLTSYE